MLISDLRQRRPGRSPHGFDPPDDTFSDAQPNSHNSGGAIFFAIQPPPSTATSISRLAWHLRDKHRLTSVPLRPRCFHLSLLGVGDHGRLPADMLAAFIAAASTIAMPRFRVSLDWVVSFRGGNKRPLVLRGDDGVGGVVWLRDKLVAATIDIGGAIPHARHGFTPHLTLLYDEQELREEPVEEVSWPVSEFVLLRSVPGEARHIVLRRWPLRG